MNASPLVNWKNGEVPEPPYYISVFNYIPDMNDREGYLEMDDLTLELAQEVEGYLGYESIKSPKGSSFISYWKDLDAIDRWRKNSTHKLAKKEGKTKWYSYYHSLIAKVESAHFHFK